MIISVRSNPAARMLRHPILLLLAINILIGILTFRDFGLSWDEPLFYDYARALGYAYSPREWISGNFDLENAYGASGSDHANRGPAYLLLARGPAALLESLGLDFASAWHLINFVTFQIGVYLLYRLAKRWLGGTGALAASALFAWQPLLWGHAFINPKDPPFLVFFLGAICFGFEMIDAIVQDRSDRRPLTLAAAFSLGIATSIRVLGPLAGLLVCLYGISQFRKLRGSVWMKSLISYGVATVMVTIISWPYLWTNPAGNFISAFGIMSDNPTQLQVLFNGELYRADELPRRYFPILLGLTLTEPVAVLFLMGMVLGVFQLRQEKLITASLILLWFLIPLAYVLLRKPPMYDGFRHFLFILPPLFIFAGFAFEWMISHSKPHWIILVAAVVLLPSVIGILSLHPYEYTYYNSLAGGTGGVFRKFETDYWLTCYKEAIEDYQARDPGPGTVYVNREAYIADTYADEQLIILDRRGSEGRINSGDLYLVNTRANEDLKAYRDAPVVLEIRRGDAIFCALKRIP